jgi:parallel beta-helix repeat protein
MKIVLLLLPVLYLLPVTIAQAAEIACGMLVTEDIVLDTNLDCRELKSSGLLIGENDITINLNGYTIAGDTSAQAGVWDDDGHSGVTIKNGAIYGFSVGVLLRNSEDVAIEHLAMAHQAWESIFIEHSADVRIEDIQVSLVYEALGNETSGVLLIDVEDAKLQDVNAEGSFYGVLSLESKEVKVINSSFIDVWHVGIRLVKNHDTVLENNRVVGAGPFDCYSAIDVVGEASKHIQIKSNTLAECGFGIFAINNPANPPNKKFTIRDNRVRLTSEGILLNGLQDSDVIGNRVHFNFNGISLWDSAEDNRIAENTATGNATWDLFHDETSIDNDWAENTCVVSNSEEIDCP